MMFFSSSLCQTSCQAKAKRFSLKRLFAFSPKPAPTCHCPKEAPSKNLPIGIHNFEKLREQKCIYVDKTALIYRLIQEGSWYFLSRPRRFGKSLLIDTMKQIFLGKRGLFKGLAIEALDYDWRPHPVIHLDFDRIPYDNSVSLSEGLQRLLQTIASECGVSIEAPSAKEGLIDLVEKVYRKTSKRVVILVDDYDKPITEYLDNMGTAKNNRAVLNDFLRTFKALDGKLHFVFITGVSKCFQGVYSPGLDHLNDITTSSQYASLLGYTEEEIRLVFHDYIEQLAMNERVDSEELLEHMRNWYNGYRFSKAESSVYNPFSTLRYLSSKDVASDGVVTDIPSFLMEQLKKYPHAFELAEGVYADEKVFNSFNLEKLELIPLMWQTGYLTIQNYNPAKREYFLHYPNKEVKKAFLEHLLGKIAEMSPYQVASYVQTCVRALHKPSMALFLKEAQIFFQSLYKRQIEEEKYYQTIVYVLGLLLGIQLKVVIEVDKSELHIGIKTKENKFFLEFLVEGPEEKHYSLRTGGKKELLLIGAGFDLENGCPYEWQEEKLLANGGLV